MSNYYRAQMVNSAHIAINPLAINVDDNLFFYFNTNVRRVGQLQLFARCFLAVLMLSRNLKKEIFIPL